MNEPEYGTPEWHQHILDTLHDETGVRVHHDRMEFPGGHTFPVLLPKIHQIHQTTEENYVDATGVIASEHLYPRSFWVGQHTNVNNEHHHYSLNLLHSISVPNKNNDVRYSTKYLNSPNLLHPEQFGPEVQKRLRTVQDPEISENERKELMEGHKKRVQKHLNRNKKIIFRGMDKNKSYGSTLYDPHTGEVQHVDSDDWDIY